MADPGAPRPYPQQVSWTPPPAPPPFLPPLPPRRPPAARMRKGRFFGGLVGAAVLAAAIGVVVAGGLRDDHTVTGDGTALVAHVLAPPSDAFEITDDVGGANGVFTLDQFTKTYFSDPASAASDLSALRFRAMAERSWVGPDGIRYDDQLIEFSNAQNADLYLGEQLGYYRSDGRLGPGFTVAGGRGTGYETVDLDRFGTRRAYLLAESGNLVVLVLAFAPGPLNRAEEAGVLTDQLRILP